MAHNVRTMLRAFELRTAVLVPVLIAALVASCTPATQSDGTPGPSGESGSSGTGGSGGVFGAGATGGVTGGTGGVTGGALGMGGASAGSGGAGMGGSVGGNGAAGTSSGGSGDSGGASAGGAAAGMAGASGSSAGSSAAGSGGDAAGTGGGSSGGYPENTGADCNVTAAEMKDNENLPDPFAMHDGTRIASKAQWSCRRNEIKKNIERYEIGTKPEPPMVEATLSGNNLSVEVTTSAGSITLTSTVGMASGAGPHCVAIGMNGNSSLISGCVQVPFMHDQVVTYANNSTKSESDPFYDVYPELWNQVSNYSAWSWGISRLIDGIDQVKDQLNVDMTKIGVHGCSYAGKMALFGGAFDERVALVIAQESGGGGINAWRTSQNFTTRTGTDIEKIDNTNYGWFLSSMQRLDPYALPHDHHELIAMIAPRAILALGNQDFEWLGDESGWKSINAAKEVWKAMGVADSIGFDFTSNHGHCAAPMSQTNAANAFVNRFLKAMTANTAIAVEPQEGNLDLDFTSVIDWQTPTLQ
jgi:hypothetical protein